MAIIVLLVAGCGGKTTTTSAPAATPGTLTLNVSAVTVLQSAGAVTISVSRTGGTTGAVSVAYTTLDGTGVAGTDYTRTSGTLTWSDGDAGTKSFNVPLVTSPGFTGTRAFSVALSGATGSASLGTFTEAVTITGSGAPGTLALSAASASAPQTTGVVTLNVSRSGGSAGSVSAAYLTQDGTAVAGTDYTRTSGTLQWADGDAATKSIAIPVLAGTPYAGTRALSLVLSGPTGGATLGLSTATVTITGLGDPGTVAISSTTVTALQSSGAATITFSRTGGSYGTASLSFTTNDGTAVGGTDYTKTTGTVSWANGDSADKTASIPLTKTPYFTGSKSLTVTGTTSVNAKLSTASAAVTITGGLLPPANYFTFSGSTYTWKLQLPIDQYGGTGGTNNIQYPSIEASNSQINAGFVDAFFYADTSTYGGATNHVVFTAPSNGASTTPGSGSDHTRSELRELYSGTGADSNKDWNSAIGGTLTASCVVQSVSVDSDEATIGQIHNQTYVFMLLIYRPAQKDVQVVVYSTLGSSAYTRTTVLSNVNIGDTLNYSINYVGNTIVTKVNGVTNTSTIDASWAGTPMYFKLGAYHAAPNIGNPAGDATQVSFSSFAISH